MPTLVKLPNVFQVNGSIPSLPSGTATIRNADTDALVSIYNDRAGASLLSSVGVTTATRGQVVGWSAPGVTWKITITQQQGSQTVTYGPYYHEGNLGSASADVSVFNTRLSSVESRPARLSITEPRFGADPAADGVWNKGAIQAALDYAGGDGVWVPPADSLAGDGIFTTGFLEVEDDYRITGAGMGRSVLRAMDALAVGNPLGTSLIQPRAYATTTVRRVTLRDLKLLGNSIGQNGGGPLLDSSGTLHGFKGIGVEYCLAERVWFEDFDGDGWYIGRGLASASPSAANKNHAVGCVFTLNVRNGSMLSDGEMNVWDRCYFIANQQGLNPASPKFGGAFYDSAELDIEPNGSGQVANHNRVVNCFFLNGWTKGIQLARSRPSVGNKILGCYFRDNAGYQITAQSSSIQDLEIGHCTFEATAPANVLGHIRCASGPDFRVHDSVFRGGTSGASSTSAVGFDDASGGGRPARPRFRNNTIDIATGVSNGNRVLFANTDDGEMGPNTWVGTENFQESGTVRTKRASMKLRGTVTWDAPLMGAGAGRNEQQTITLNGSPTGGSSTWVWNSQTTGAINWNATKADVQAALEALSNIDPGDILVSGGPFPTAAIQVEFTGAKAGQNQAAITLGVNSLTGGTTPAPAFATVQDGAPNSASTTVTVTGAALGDVVAGVSASVNLGAAHLIGVVTAADTVTITILNLTGSVINPNNATYVVLVDKVLT